MSIVVILFWAILALLADQIVPFNYHQMGALLNAPPGAVDPATSYVHWMGTDNLGRDIFSRLLSGTRLSLTICLAADLLITFIGVAVGLVSGYFGGAVDNLLMRITDIMFAFPGLVFAMVMVAVLGRSIEAVLIALGISNWVGMARLVRGQVLQTKQMDYVLAAHSLGARPLDIMIHHLLPNILGPILVFSTLIIPGIVTAEAALAFLNIGVDPSLPTLGGLINYGWDSISSHPTEIAFPILTLAMLTLSFTLLGDSLSDALDPKRR
ncbi:MAG TPA: ABC transporter permease [Aggregatilineales bacterium]|nr:ABC transporter permease [Aggregatilineales bacterium]